MNYAKAIRLCRRAQGLTQKELATRAGVSARTLSSLENGSARPSDDQVKAIASALRVSNQVFALLAWEPGDDGGH